MLAPFLDSTQTGVKLVVQLLKVVVLMGFQQAEATDAVPLSMESIALQDFNAAPLDRLAP